MKLFVENLRLFESKMNLNLYYLRILGILVWFYKLLILIFIVSCFFGLMLLMEVIKIWSIIWMYSFGFLERILFFYCEME